MFYSPTHNLHKKIKYNFIKNQTQKNIIAFKKKIKTSKIERPKINEKYFSFQINENDINNINSFILKENLISNNVFEIIDNNNSSDKDFNEEKNWYDIDKMDFNYEQSDDKINPYNEKSEIKNNEILFYYVYKVKEEKLYKKFIGNKDDLIIDFQKNSYVNKTKTKKKKNNIENIFENDYFSSNHKNNYLMRSKSEKEIEIEKENLIPADFSDLHINIIENYYENIMNINNK